jgi:hypothetical protein
MRPNPRRSNLLLSANTTMVCAVSIIFWFKVASAKFDIDIPKSTSIPSTPIKSILHDMSSKTLSAFAPATDDELGLMRPPNCSTSTFGRLLNSTPTFKAGVIKVFRRVKCS